MCVIEWIEHDLTDEAVLDEIVELARRRPEHVPVDAAVRRFERARDPVRLPVAVRDPTRITGVGVEHARVDGIDRERPLPPVVERTRIATAVQMLPRRPAVGGLPQTVLAGAE